MAIPLIAAGVSGAANILGGMKAGEAQRSAANKAYAAQKEAIIKMQEMLEAVGLPSVEAQKLALENPEYAGDLIAEKLGPSALESIQEDTRMQDAQMEALNRLQELGEVGLTAEDRAERAEMLREGAAQGQAAQEQILQNMAQRGNLDSGASLIAQLQANAAQQTDARRQSEQMAADVESRRRDAIMQAANMAQGMESAKFSRDAQKANAADLINRFNVQASNQAQERNLAARQNIENQRVATANEQQRHNKGLLQQDYNNRMARATGQANLVNQMGQAQAQRQQQIGAANAQQAAGMGSAIGNLATAAGGFMAKNPNALSGLFGGGSPTPDRAGGTTSMSTDYLNMK